MPRISKRTKARKILRHFVEVSYGVRKIGGKRYTEAGSAGPRGYSKKSEAIAFAEKIRKQGGKARVIQQPEGPYRVFIRFEKDAAKVARKKAFQDVRSKSRRS